MLLEMVRELPCSDVCFRLITGGSGYYSSNGLNAATLGAWSQRGAGVGTTYTQSGVGNGSVEARSPLAATRANSVASAASPTGSACLKTPPDLAPDLLL